MIPTPHGRGGIADYRVDQTADSHRIGRAGRNAVTADDDGSRANALRRFRGDGDAKIFCTDDIIEAAYYYLMSGLATTARSARDDGIVSAGVDDVRDAGDDGATFGVGRVFGSADKRVRQAVGIDVQTDL